MAELTSEQLAKLRQVRPDVSAEKYYGGRGDKGLREWWSKYGKNVPDLLGQLGGQVGQNTALPTPTYQNFGAYQQRAEQQVSPAYDEARKTYSEMLPKMQAKYDDILRQLEEEKGIQVGQTEARHVSEQTRLKDVIAKRGLKVDPESQYYSGQAGELRAGQELESRQVLNQYAKLKTEATSEGLNMELQLKDKMANISIEKQNAIMEQFHWSFATARSELEQDRAFEEAKRQADRAHKLDKKRFKWEKKSWGKEFDWAKEKFGEEKAMELARIAKSGGSGSAGDKESEALLNTWMTMGALAAEGMKLPSGFREMIREGLKTSAGKKTWETLYQDFWEKGFGG